MGHVISCTAERSGTGSGCLYGELELKLKLKFSLSARGDYQATQCVFKSRGLLLFVVTNIIISISREKNIYLVCLELRLIERNVQCLDCDETFRTAALLEKLGLR